MAIQPEKYQLARNWQGVILVPDNCCFTVDFHRAGLNYSEFAVVADYGSFRSTGRVEDIVMDLSSR